MAFQTLGLSSPAGSYASIPAGRPAAAASGPQRPDLAEYGATGTPIFGGFLRERGEYNPELVGLEAIRVYEQMRRSDGQVAATLMATKLPILAAKWDVTVPEDASPMEHEAAEFVRQCLFEDLDFLAVLRNALLMLDFGCAAHEDIYQIVGNRVRLAKLAPRLPLTFYRWITDKGGEDLAALEQLGYRGEEYVTTQVPANKLSLFTNNQEGANYTGMSLLRPMYQHWYIKSQLYKVDAIAAERNGMGVPWIEMGPDSKKEDRELAKEWVSSLVAHERTGMVLPSGWKFKLEGVTGVVHDCKESIAHHNMAISTAGLSMFMMLGQSQHGSHALGATMADFFFTALESTSHYIARVLSLTTVKRLVDFNFPGVTNYPRVTPQEILTLKFEAIVEALNKLAQFGVVQPDGGLESWMREKMGAPEVDPLTVRIAAPPTPPTAGKPGAPEPEAASAKPGANSGAEDAPADGAVDVGAAAMSAVTFVEAVKAVLMDVGSVHVDSSSLNGGGLKLRREPRGVEKHLALSEIVGGLDKGRADVAAVLRRARPRVQAEIVHKLVDSPVRNIHRVSVAPDTALTGEVEGILRGVSSFGRGQVSKERDRQLAGKAPADAATIRLADAVGKRDQVGLFADGVVSRFTEGISSRAKTMATRSKVRDTGKGQMIQQLGDDLDAQSDKWIDGVAGEGANQAFADGRQDGYEQYKDEIAQTIYSALLDINTCDACSSADGEEGETPDDVPDVPNPDCDGGDKCRCVHVFVFGDEAKAAA